MSPTRVVRDQFVGGGQLRRAEFLWMAPAVIVSGFALGAEVELRNAAMLLTATSILTGLTFSMTTTFWGKNIDARRDPQRALNPLVLDVLDRNLAHLVWTVAVGLAATGVLVLTAIFASSDGAPVWLTALCSFFLVYLITLVGVALQRFVEAALLLR